MAVIGLLRPEEAKVSDGEAGYHSFTNEDGQSYGSFEVIWLDYEIDGEDETKAGWYWWPCFPGCLPEDGPNGPFASSRAARQDADEYWED